MWIGTGVLIPTIPILIYFGINHALPDMWTVYFYNNLFSYPTKSNHFFIFSLASNLLSGMKNVISKNRIPILLIGASLLALMKKKDKMEFFSYLMMGICTFLLVYIGGRHFTYYAFIFNAFAPVGILTIYQTLQIHLFSKLKMGNILRVAYRFTAEIICVGSIIFTFIMCNNTYLLNYNKSDLPQYQFAEIIAQKENATLLNYGFLDGGFYTTTGIVPNCRYFCNLNIKLAEIMETQNEFVEQGKIDFIIARDKELESKRYECIATTTFYFEGVEKDYFLYQRIS